MKLKNSHCIKGKWIDCKPATPKEIKEQTKSNSNSNIFKYYLFMYLKIKLLHYK